MVGTTTFAIEECLSSRDGRSVPGDRVATDALMSNALAVIGDFHRLTATRRQVDARVLAAIVEPEFGATFASSQVDGSAREKCFHYA
jgi:hypothetical protein